MIAAASALANTLLPPDLPRGVGTWNTKGLGNHRIVIQVLDASRDAIVTIPWRRRDRDPSEIGVILTDSHGTQINNLARRLCTQETGQFVFEPHSGPGTYYLYFMPFEQEGTYYPKVHYLPHKDQAAPEWHANAKRTADESDFARATVTRLESASDLDQFSPMEIIATEQEATDLLRAHPDAPFLVFPEDRMLSIRMPDQIPYRWAVRGANMAFAGSAKRGESYAYQLGVWAVRSSLQGLKVEFEALKGPSGAAIGPDRMTCLNLEGVGYDGKAFKKQMGVPKGQVQALWVGIEVPSTAKPGIYRGSVSVSARGRGTAKVPISLKVLAQQDDGLSQDDPYRMTRIAWLNSKLGLEDQIVHPFVENQPLGFEWSLAENGLFQQVTRTISSRLDRFEHPGTALLASDMAFVVECAEGPLKERIVSRPTRRRKGQTATTWRQSSELGPVVKAVDGELQFDGSATLRITLSAKRDIELKDIRLELPFSRSASQYFMGLGRLGGRTPKSLDWRWDVRQNQEGAWLGAVNCGVLFALRDEHYSRPLNTNFYHEKPLVMPVSWSNQGKGGIRLRTVNGAVRVTCYSGQRTMKKGETLHFNVRLQFTPSKLIDPKKHFAERYFHKYESLDKIQAEGANIVNVHHATKINPWINYPFLGFTSSSLGFDKVETEGGVEAGDPGPADMMKAYIAEAHRRGMKVKIYDTVRELTNRAPELFMLKSLGHEVFSPGKGGGGSWLREHLDGDYIPAWHAIEVGDAAIVNSGMSRWHNYYVEGLDWLARKVGIDGLYLDDVAFDRTTMLRVRRVLERRIAERSKANLQANKPTNLPTSPIIDLHSANQHNERDGWNNSTILYMDLMPYVDRLWFGEYFDYNKGPDTWLVEMSGLPFGLMGEMLQDGGNPWRGMLFGMTARRPWSGDPRPLWKAWDAFGITQSELIGWWSIDCPVKTDNPEVLATVYRHKGAESGKRSPAALIAIASWAKGDVDVKLKVDWRALGMVPEKAKLSAGKIEGFQEASKFDLSKPIRVPAGKGWLLLLQ